MTWGPSFMYYHCEKCGHKFKYALDLMTEFGEEFGKCPRCGGAGVYEKEMILITRRLSSDSDN